MSTVQPRSEPPADTLGPTVLRMMLGNQLHRFREAADVLAATVAAHLANQGRPHGIPSCRRRGVLVVP